MKAKGERKRIEEQQPKQKERIRRRGGETGREKRKKDNKRTKAPVRVQKDE